VLHGIRARWVPQRLDTLRLRPGSDWLAWLDSAGVRNAFMGAARAFAADVPMAADAIAAHSGPVLFEGAQGLLLDAEHRWFPHVTRSRTGLTNVAILAQEAGIEALDVTYVTRAYATRHGAGPFPRQVDASYPDATNVPNSWQGTLRFERLDLDLLHEAVAADMAASPLPVSHRLAVTCLDQVGERVEFWHGDTARTAAPAAMLDTAQALLGGGLIASFGPTRDTLGVGGRLGRRQRHAA
jgi:adenylosuccinate synthase